MITIILIKNVIDSLYGKNKTVLKINNTPEEISKHILIANFKIHLILKTKYI